ncbi:MAG: hypothetical protein JEY94_06855 [Melioribacteraceae bacterium]|nr:hypothetical protein [Melioribacteraceae bacterium]
MTHSQLRVLNGFLKKINSCTNEPGQWYIGVCSNPERTLSNEHKVNLSGNEYCIDRCATAPEAVQVALALMEHLSIQGNIPEKTFNFETFIYGFKKNNSTIPPFEKPVEEKLELAEA